MGLNCPLFCFIINSHIGYNTTIHVDASSNVNEVIKTVLNFVYIYFFMTRFYTHKKHKKNTRHQIVPKGTKSTKKH